MPDRPEDFTIPGTLAGSNSTVDADARRNQEIVTQLARDFQARNDLFEEYERAVFYENDVYVPPDYKLTTVISKSPLPSHIVNTVTAALSINPPSIQFRPVKDGDPGQTNAELRRHFFEASQSKQEEEGENRWFRMFINALVMKGEGVLKTIERKNLAWGGYNTYIKNLGNRLDDPEDEEYGRIAQNNDEDSRRRVLKEKAGEYKRAAPYPILTTDVLPETFYYWKTAEGFSLCAEIKEVPYLDTLAKYGAGLSSSGAVVAKEAMGVPRSEWDSRMEGVKTLKMYEIWRPTYCEYWLAGPGQITSAGNNNQPIGTLVKKIPHKYGNKQQGSLRGPYFHALGITTHSRLPHRAGLGILYGFLPLFKLLDSLLTIQSNAAYMTGFPAFAEDGEQGLRLPPPGEFGDDNASGTAPSAPASLRVVPGRVLPRGVRPIDQPRGSLVLDKVMDDTRKFIELALPSVVQGIIDSDPSGYAINQAAHLARLAWNPIVDNAQFALSRRVGFESWLIEKCLNEDVYVWGPQPTGTTLRRRQAQDGWLSIGPKDLAGVHRYTCRLNPETPSNRVIEGRTHEGLVNNRFETLDDARLELGGDPEAIERWWELYDFKQNPEIKKQIHDRALEMLRLKVQRAAIAAGAIAPTPGTTGVPGAPAPGGGVPSAMNDAMGPMGTVQMPGQDGQPMMPVPQGQPNPGGPAGSIAGMAGGIPGPPARHIALPGQ